MASTNPLGSQQNPHLKRAFALNNPNEAQSLYDEWAETYDTDLAGMKYSLPKVAAETLNNAVRAQGKDLAKISILDAGCGTGLVGVQLRSRGAKIIDGNDISQKMLDRARTTNAYEKLEVVDLTAPVSVGTDRYEAVICVGTLTQGHLGPEPINDLVRVVRRETGLVVLTIGAGMWASGGYRDKVESLESSGVATVLMSEGVGVVEGEKEGAWLVVMQKA